MMFRRWWQLALAAGICAAARDAPVPTGAQARPPSIAADDTSPRFGRLPVRFEANEGQHDPRARFVARPEGAALFLTTTGPVLAVGEASIKLVVDQGRAVEPRPGNELVTRSSYFIGSDPSQWRTDIRSYGQVTYPSVLDGVDLVFHGEEGQLEYDFIVAPGVDASSIAVVIDGASSLSLREDGALAIHTPAGELVQPKPRVFQRDALGDEEDVRAGYRLLGGTKVAFALGHYDPDRELVIDPVLQYSALIGGTEASNGIATDAAGNVYITGRTSAVDFPTVAPLKASRSGPTDAFVAKMNPAGTALLWATYVGGDQSDNASGIDVDAAGNVYVAGDTISNDFPAVSAFQATRAGLADAFAIKLSPSGASLLYSTLLGGSATDEARSVRVDASGQAHVVGETVSTDFPTQSPHQPSNAGGISEVFITKLNASGSGLVYSTYLGSAAEDRSPPGAFALDAGNNVVIAGWSYGAFPVTPGAFQTTKKNFIEAYVAKLGPTGTLGWATYLGGINADHAYGVAVDSANRIYVAGVTQSPDFPVKGSMQPFQGDDVFVSKLEPNGASLVWSTFFGSSANEQVRGPIAVDANGCVAFAGWTSATSGFPLLNAVQTVPGGMTDAFVAKLNPGGSALVFSTLLGGNTDDRVSGVAVDPSGDVVVTGNAGSHSFPSTVTFGSGAGGATFVTKLVTSPLVGSPAVVSIPPGASRTFTATGGDPPYRFTLAQSPSGATITPAGVYTAGAVAGTVDTIEVRDRGDRKATMQAWVSGPIAIAPSSPSVAPLATIHFSAEGGTGTGFTWSLAENESNGSIDATTGIYTAGPATMVFDRVEVRDSLGNVGFTEINVGGVLSILPAAPTAPPRGAIAFTATGGAGGHVWSMVAAPSGGTVEAATGSYRAGAIGSVTDRLAVTDSAGASITVDVTVGPNLAISPASATIALGERLNLTVTGGSGAGHVWSFVTNASGATISPAGELIAGPTPGIDVVVVKDDLDNSAEATVTVEDRSPPPTGSGTATGPSDAESATGCACRASGTSPPSASTVLGVLAALAMLRRRPRRH